MVEQQPDVGQTFVPNTTAVRLKNEIYTTFAHLYLKLSADVLYKGR